METKITEKEFIAKLIELVFSIRNQIIRSFIDEEVLLDTILKNETSEIKKTLLRVMPHIQTFTEPTTWGADVASINNIEESWKTFLIEITALAVFIVKLLSITQVGKGKENIVCSEVCLLNFWHTESRDAFFNHLVNRCYEYGDALFYDKNDVSVGIGLIASNNIAGQSNESVSDMIRGFFNGALEFYTPMIRKYKITTDE